MSDTFITIIIIITAAVLIFVVPVIAVARRNDVESTQAVQAAVTEFVDKTRTTGVITRQDYDNLLAKIEATGNLYDLQVSIQQIDENPAKKSTSNVTDELKIGENVYYIQYTTQVEEAFAKSNDETIKLSLGNYVRVDARNRNQTLYETFKRTLYNLTDGKIGSISGVHVGIVIEPAEGEQIGNVPGAGTQYVIRYDVNGGLLGTGPEVQYKNKGEDLTLSDVKPIHADSNLRFVGWAEDKNATEALYPSGGVFTKDDNTTLYAVWKKATYNIAYSSNLSGHIEGLPTQDAGLQLGQTYTIWNGRQTPKSDGYIFVKWNTSPDGTGTSYNSGDTITISESKILYAIWKTESFVLKFDKNSGSALVSNMPANQNCNYWETFTLPNNIPTRNNYKFLGWSTRKDGEVEYKAGENCVIEPYNNTLYAIWGEKHTLQYKSNTKVLIVGYNNSSWVNSIVKYFNEQGQFEADGMLVEVGNLEAVEDKKEEYDLIIMNTSAWCVDTIDSNGKNIMQNIASSTHLITMGNDERYVPFIEESRYLSDINVDISATDKGNELIGEKIGTQSDSELYSANFSSDTTVLYTATYKDGNGEVKGTGDVIGLGHWRANNNWIHIQLSSISNSILHKLGIIAINGLETPRTIVNNMPQDEIRGYREKFNLSSNIPTRNNCTFMGWAETPTGEVKYTAGQDFTMPNQDIVLYAVWGANIEYRANIKALIVGYSPQQFIETKKDWVESAVNYLNQTGDFVAEAMIIEAGQLQKVVDRREDFDVIVINASSWTVSNIDSGGRSKLEKIAKSTHLITIANDETNIPLIKNYKAVQDVNVKITPTMEGRRLIGEEMNVQTDEALRAITFNSNVTTLYIASYVDINGTEEYKKSGDVVGFYEYNNKTNWIHGQVNEMENSMLYKLIRTALNGLNMTESIVKNMPNDTMGKHGTTMYLSGATPTMKGYTFKGWAETPDGEVKYKAGEEFVTPKGNQTLYAVWKKK